MTKILSLAGRTALVTGASSGLGERFAIVLAEAGARVAVAARRIDRLGSLVTTIKAAGGQAIAVEMDVADEQSTIEAYDSIEAAFGPVDTIVANAGMNGEGSAVELPIAEFDRVIAVNLRGPFLTAREGARRMMASGSRERGHGRIIITASITAHKVDPGLAAYSASKAGVVQMGKVLAKEWVRQGINVNMICPGYIKTEMTADWFETEAGARQLAKFPRRRLMDGASMDGMLLYLASDASAGVTGAEFTLDDGQSL